jgi:hypothetical protein
VRANATATGASIGEATARPLRLFCSTLYPAPVEAALGSAPAFSASVALRPRRSAPRRRTTGAMAAAIRVSPTARLRMGPGRGRPKRGTASTLATGIASASGVRLGFGSGRPRQGSGSPVSIGIAQAAGVRPEDAQQFPETAGEIGTSGVLRRPERRKTALQTCCCGWGGQRGDHHESSEDGEGAAGGHGAAPFKEAAAPAAIDRREAPKQSGASGRGKSPPILQASLHPRRREGKCNTSTGRT